MTGTADGRRERSEVTRARLLAAAGHLFAARGYAETTLDLLAREARVHRALVRYHFGSKAGLYEALLREAIRLGVELLEPVRLSDGPAPERLAAFADALGNLLERRPWFAAVVAREWMSGGAHMPDDVLLELGQFFRIDREILEAGREKGELVDVDPHAAHLALVGSLVFFQISRPLRERRADEIPAAPPGAADYLDDVKRIFRRGLSRRAPEDSRS